ncbi:hypothetical protein MMC30_007893 [Trapelia coarctata]|nr:hypothetical protein [Trapelia coarctata]
MALQEPVYDKTRPFPVLEPLYQYKLISCPGKSMVGMKVLFAPNGSSPPHRHGNAFVTAHVLEGSVYNKMNDDPMKLIKAGESWYEAPGCHHKISDNASPSEPATLLVTFVLDTETIEKEGYSVLIQIDEEYR